MLNRFATFLFVATSLSPVLGAVAVNQIDLGRPASNWLPWLVVALLLVLVCWLMLRHAAQSSQTRSLTVTEFENNDKEVLAYLLTYLLPFISSKDMAFTGQWLTGAYVLIIIFLVISHANAFHFNPVMGLLGYHFYGVKDKDGRSALLISGKEIRRPTDKLQVVSLRPNIYLRIKESEK